MKKSEQILAYHFLIFLTALTMFIIALVTKKNTLTPFGFVLLVGGTAIRVFAKKENPYNNIVRKVTDKVGESITKSKVESQNKTQVNSTKSQTINEAWDDWWNNFIKWLHE